MLKILYLGDNNKVNILLNNKNIKVDNILDIQNKCIFNIGNYNIILIDDILYSKYLNQFSCLNYNKNIIVLYDVDDDKKLDNYNNVETYYSINYFLKNIDLLINFYILKIENQNNKIAEYVYNYTHLENKLLNKKNLINIHLYDLGFYYKFYGYTFLKSILNEFSNGLLKLIKNNDNLFILGQSDYFITSNNKNKYDLEILCKQIIQYFKINNFSIQNIDIKFKFKIALNYDENPLKLISKTLNSLNNTTNYSTLNTNYNDELILKQKNNFKIAKKIKESFINNEFITYYQPIMENKTNKITIYECLIRDIKNNLKPNEIIPILQKTNLTSLVTDTIINDSFNKLSGEKTKISINICIEDLENSKLINFIKEKQKKYGVSSNRIIFEVVESFSSYSNKYVINQLKTLKDNGYQIALDNFGMYESNFSILFELDIDYIKIDKNFISKLENPKYLKIVKGFVAFAHSINTKVIAVYVNNEKIQKIIKNLGIEYSQGYYIGKPQLNI